MTGYLMSPFWNSARQLTPLATSRTFGSKATLIPRSPNPRPWICRDCQILRRQSSTGADRQGSFSSVVRAKTSYSSGKANVRSLAWRRTMTVSMPHREQLRKAADEEKTQSLQTEAKEKLTELGKAGPGTNERLQTLVSTVRLNWNDLVGYTDIEKQREKVEAQEQLIKTKRLALQEARDGYRLAVEKHAASLRDSRDLLARKDEWTEKDAVRFTTLHQAVRANEIAEKSTRQASAAAELDLERETERLGVTIGKVYQAESMYNSKIIQMKTWWTWALMALNATVFLVNVYLIQVGLSPRSRRAVGLSDEAIAKIRDAVLEASRAPGIPPPATETASLAVDAESDPTVAEPEPLAEIMVEARATLDPKPGPIGDVASYRERLRDLFSDRPITVRQVDVISASLESLFAGMVLTSLVFRFLRGS